MSVDISKIKVGDKITVEHIVTMVYKSVNMIQCNYADGVPIYAVKEHTPAPRPIKAGDRVKTACEGITYRVVAVESDSAWLCGETGRYWTAPLSTLEHADTLVQGFKIGDVVTYGGRAENFKLVAINDDLTELCHENGWGVTIALSRLEHADES